jgi:hypothetical protein
VITHLDDEIPYDLLRSENPPTFGLVCRNAHDLANGVSLSEHLSLEQMFLES